MRSSSWAAALLLLSSGSGWSQELSPAAATQNDSTAAAIHELQQQVKELRSAMAEMRSETEQYRAENAALRRELQSTSGPGEAALRSPGDSSPPVARSEERRVGKECRSRWS